MLSQHFMGYGFGAASSPAVARLQRALALLGFAVNDTALAVNADGITGPATAAAVNRAMTKYVTTAPASLRTGKLTPLNVSQNAAPLSSAIESAAASRSAPGSKQLLTTTAPRAAAPAVAPKRPAAGASRSQVQAMQNALRSLGSKIGDKTLMIAADGAVGPKTVAAVNKAVSSYGVYSRQVTAADLTNPNIVTSITSEANAKASIVTKPVAPAPSKPTKSPTVQRLQQAIAALGKKLGDKVLQIGADGLIGPKTATAVNRALASIATAPSQFRTGMLSQSDIVMNAESIAKIVEAHLAQLGVKPPKLPAAAPKPGLSRSAAITQIQQSLGQLALLAKDPGLTVPVDGINGPKTTAAVNRALSDVGPCSKLPHTGLSPGYSIAQVSAKAESIANNLAARIAECGETPTQVTEVPKPSPEPDQIVAATATTPAQTPAVPAEQLPTAEQAAAAAAQARAEAEAVAAAKAQEAAAQAQMDRALAAQAVAQAAAAQATTPAQEAQAKEAVAQATQETQAAAAQVEQAQAATQAVQGKRPVWHYIAAGVGVIGLGTIGYFAFRGKKSQSGYRSAPRRRLRTA
jgi:hypothetical protein